MQEGRQNDSVPVGKSFRKDRTAIPYAIDRTKDDLTLADITRSAINFLSKDLSKGFFLMVEGGK